jgi:nitrite reductase/ring-hydroxylating ferredoxin subunit
VAGRERVICTGAALIDGGAGIRFDVMRDGRPAPAFVVRFGGVVRAYLNRCMHQATELDWEHGDFFDERKLYLICASHGAVYDPSTGICVGGPCKGARLAPVEVSEHDGTVFAGEDFVLLPKQASS